MCLTLVCHVSFIHFCSCNNISLSSIFLSKTRHATQNSVYLILSLSQGSVAENIHRRTFTYHTFCLLRSLLPNTVISSDAISFSHSSYFLRLMRFPPLVDMYGNLQERLVRAAPLQSKDSTVTYPWIFFSHSFRYYWAQFFYCLSTNDLCLLSTVTEEHYLHSCSE